MLTASPSDHSLYTIPYLDGAIIYLPLKRMAFYADRETTNFVERLGNSGGKSVDAAAIPPLLEQLGFFAADPPAPEPISPASPFKPTTCVLLPTTACNLKCVYCYASPEVHGETLEVAKGKEAIDIVCNNAQALGRDSFEVAFHGGGEPTLVIPILRELVAYSRTKPLISRISLTTNGFWSEARRREILDLGLSSVSVSLDGKAAVQNKQRPTLASSQTFDMVMETIHELNRQGIAYGIRMTVIEDSVDQLAESIDDLCRATSCRTFQVEPAFAHGRALSAGVCLTDIDRFVQAFGDAYDVATSYGRDLYYSGARPWVTTSTFCLAPVQALIVTTNGELTMCYEVFGKSHSLAERFFFGTIESGKGLLLDRGARERVFERLAERRSLCRNCICFYSCAGDCITKAFGPGGNDYLTFGDRCTLNRAITKELLIRFVEDSGGVWRGNQKDREGGCV